MGSRIRSDPNHVFEFFCEIEIPSNNSQAPWITWKFPPNYKDEETLKSLPEFAYPCEFSNNAVHHFSFVLTNIDSKWTFGFCRHAPNSPTCFVLLSYLPWHEIFYKVLNHVADLSHKEKIGQHQRLQKFLETMYKVSVPDPGLELHVNCGQNEEFVAVCPDHHKLPTIPENRNMTEYFNAVDAHNMMVIFASMLHERRILVTSKKLSRLSSCIQAANALIYPMHWQHIFIPVLPKHLLDYLSAPMPFLIGVPSSTFSRIKASDMGDVVLLDSDKNKVETPFADLDTLPSEILQSLRHDLKHPQEMLGDAVARAFLKALVKLIGGYWNALKLKPGEKISFSPEMFLQTRPAPMQPFLEKMLNLQIFQQFIESRLKMLNSGRGVSDEFEFELTAHEDKASTRLRNQYKDWVAYMKKEGGAFFKNVKTKMKDTSKKAYRDIRSRMKEIHNHKVGLDTAPDFRKRGNSVPGIFTVDGDPEKYFNKNGLKKDNFSHSKMEDLDDNVFSEPGKVSAEAKMSSSGQESPKLTFKSIDMDLMSDLHELIFRRCSLCNDRSQQRTSISDPQLIEFSEDKDQRSVHVPDVCARHSTAVADSMQNSVPPPLLPRPPHSKTKVSPRTSYGLSNAPQPQRPLIILDAEPANSETPEYDSFKVSHKQNVNTNELSKIFSKVEVSHGELLFSDCVSEESINSESEKSNSSMNSSNPFRQSKERFEIPVRSISKCSSGPNVRSMIDMWQQSSTQQPETASISNSSEVMKDSIPYLPYRSQPLSRTVSTPPAIPAVPQLSTPRTKNPFLGIDSEASGLMCEENSKFGTTFSSWESFH